MKWKFFTTNALSNAPMNAAPTHHLPPRPLDYLSNTPGCGRASFPTVVFRDVRMTAAGGGGVRGASPRNLWSALSLSTINAMLSKPLTEEEVMFNQVCSRRETTSMPASPSKKTLMRLSVPCRCIRGATHEWGCAYISDGTHVMAQCLDRNAHMASMHHPTKPLCFHLCLQESSPDTSKLPRFSVPFIPCIIGAGPVTITLQVWRREERERDDRLSQLLLSQARK